MSNNRNKDDQEPNQTPKNGITEEEVQEIADEMALGLEIQARWGMRAGNDVIRMRREWRAHRGGREPGPAGDVGAEEREVHEENKCLDELERSRRLVWRFE